MACFTFPTASDSRNISDLRAIHAEICDIETAILDARELGLRTIDVCDSPMALSTAHYDAWNINVNQNQCSVAIVDPTEAHLIDLQNQCAQYQAQLDDCLSELLDLQNQLNY